MPPGNSNNPDNTPFDEILGYEAAFYCLPDPVFIYNHTERRIMNANDAAVRRYGYTAEQFQDLGPWDVESPYDQNELVSLIDKLKDEGSAVYQAEHRSADGESFPAEVHTVYHNLNGVEIFVAVCREVSERLSSEKRLREAELHYRAIFENVVNLICVADLKSATFLDVNPAFEKLLGYSRAELLEKPFTELVHPDDVEPTRKVIETMLHEGKTGGEFQNRYRCKDGRYVWLDWSSQLLMDQGRAYAVARDITEQKWFEDRLRLQNQRLLLHVEQTPLGVIEWSLDFKVKEWNQAAERIFGYSKEEAIGRVGTFIADPKNIGHIDQVWSQLISNAGGERSLNPNVHKNGSRLLCEWYNTTLIDASGQIIGVASLVSDATEQERRKLELEQAKEEAEKANRAKSEFLSMMSHELRTPLNSIVGPCELIKEQIQDPAMAPLLEVMQTSSSHLLDLINSILDLSKIESGSIDINVETYSASDFFAQRLLPLKVAAEKKGLKFIIQDDLASGTVLKTDGRLLLQALFNTVGNSVKFTESGSITVRVESVGDRLRIDVVDTGVGIDRELQKKLFEPFRQGKVALSKSQRGSGLGLSITKRLVEILGGEIGFTSVPQNGSTFTILMPSVETVKAAPVLPRRKKVEKTKDNSGKGKILLVEDEPNNQLVNRALLKFLNYPHDVASTGEEAVSLWEAHRYSIVLMDINLPGIDGLEACRQIKALANGEPVTVIAQSAHALAEQRENFLHRGMDDYISKPISLEALKSVLEKAEA